MYGLNYDGLKKKPKYNELIDYVMNKQEKIKYPNRTAKFLRESPQLSNLLDGDGEGVLEMEEQQKRQMLAVEIEHAIRRASGSGPGGSAAELNVNMAQSLGGQAGGSQAGGSQAGGSQAGGSQAGGLQAGGLQAGGLQAGGSHGSSAFIQDVSNTLDQAAASTAVQQAGYQVLGQDIAQQQPHYLDATASSTVNLEPSQSTEQNLEGFLPNEDTTGLEITGTLDEKITEAEDAIDTWQNNSLSYNINQLIFYYYTMIQDPVIIEQLEEQRKLNDEGEVTKAKNIRNQARQELMEDYGGLEGRKELAELFIKQLNIRERLKEYKQEKEELVRLVTPQLTPQPFFEELYSKFRQAKADADNRIKTRAASLELNLDIHSSPPKPGNFFKSKIAAPKPPAGPPPKSSPKSSPKPIGPPPKSSPKSSPKPIGPISTTPT